MNLKWSFIVRGAHSYLYDLSHHLDSADIVIYEDGEEGIDLTQYFSSVHLNHLTNPEEIYSKAYQICSFLNGAEFLMYENKADAGYIRLDRLINIDQNKVVHYNPHHPIERIDIDFTINQISKHSNNHIVAEIMRVAKSDIFIQTILFMCAHEMNFRAIYQTLDEVKNFLKAKGTNLNELGFSDKVLKSLTHTANNYETLGLAARHGSMGHEAPKTPMIISEAQTLITQIIRTTFEKSFDFNLPFVKKSNFDISEIRW
ncbi:hypothetical protein [Sphingobacterium gobiense]|uniref:Uncharacterized protein n=1 Tax=Sphingobacterium gobiense TaxID=1382456 RepID=A0A2S9JTZ3_9SPHI|nr:hypothetical protein [Sphingobacterium gobiense]PRD56710.1 hypothetical protein C5749_05620 [Sphingobacterium gobiense]